MQFLAVFLGGGIGSLCRYLISYLMASQNLSFPLATLIANLISSFILGFAVYYFMKMPNHGFLKIFFTVGFCGGFSTFSTFSLETFRLFEVGNYTLALLNCFLSIVVCLFAIYLGLYFAKSTI